MAPSKAVVQTPNYRPPPLRPAFVSAVALIILLGIVLLELGCRLLPVERDLSSIESHGDGPSGTEASRDVVRRLAAAEAYALRRRQSQGVQTPGDGPSSPRATPFVPVLSVPASTSLILIGDAKTGLSPPGPTRGFSVETASKPLTATRTIVTKTSAPKSTAKGEAFTMTAFSVGPADFFSSVDKTVVVTKPLGPNTVPIITFEVLTTSTPVPPVSSPTPTPGNIGIVNVPTKEPGVTAVQVGPTQPAQPPQFTIPSNAPPGSVGVRPLADNKEPVSPNGAALAVAGPPSDPGVQVIKVAEVIVATPRVLTNSYGVPTATFQDVPSGFVVSSAGTYTITLATYDVTVSPVVTYLTDGKGVVTATSTTMRTLRPQPTANGTEGARETGSPGALVTVQLYKLTSADYFVGFFLPTMMAVILAILVRIISLTAMLYQPFNALTRPQSATATESLCLRTGLFHGIYSSFHGLRHSSAVPFLSALLALCATTLTPLASEAVGLKLRGSCRKGSANGCGMQLAVAELPVRITMGILSFMLAVAAAIFVILFRWRSGVASSPWSLAAVSAMSRDERLRRALCIAPDAKGQITRQQLTRGFDGLTFNMGFAAEPGGAVGYGIAVEDTRPRRDEADARPRLRGRSGTVMTLGATMVHVDSDKRRRVVSSVLFLLLDAGLLIIIFYYNTTTGDSGFERFMDHQTFGVRFLFAALGVIVTLFWSSFFRTVATNAPFRALAASPPDPRRTARSLVFSPPTDPFSGLGAAVAARDPLLAVMAGTAAVAEFTPLLLANVPFLLTQTKTVHDACTWLAAAILLWMAGVAVYAGFFVRWPVLPVRPDTVAGLMYYVTGDRHLSGLFEGMGLLSGGEMRRRVSGMRGGGFATREVEGDRGERRMAVVVMDDGDDMEEVEYIHVGVKDET